jgi:hypothetical protein
MDEHRRRWMLAVLERENRIGDVNIIGNLMTSTSFLANNSIFILAGLVALLGAPDLGARVLAALPFAAPPASDAAWEIRIALLVVIFVRAFFELTWALRQFNYCCIVVGGLGFGPEFRPAPRWRRPWRTARAALQHRAARLLLRPRRARLDPAPRGPDAGLAPGAARAAPARVPLGHARGAGGGALPWTMIRDHPITDGGPALGREGDSPLRRCRLRGSRPRPESAPAA